LIIAYLHHYYKPDGTVEQTRMQQRARSYQIADNDLYKISVSGLLLHCVSKDKGQQILSEIHAGVYEGYIGATALTTKILWQGFYWPPMIDEGDTFLNHAKGSISE
jgi:hypothetical protein